MMRLKALGAGLLAALALAATASSASAVPKLWLVVHLTGSRAAVGEAAQNTMIFRHPPENWQCAKLSKGEVRSNGRASDALAFPAPFTSECIQNSAQRGGTSIKVAVTAQGGFKVTLKPKEAIEEPNLCVYELNTFEWHFTPGRGEAGRLKVTGTAPVTLDKPLTLAEGCSATQALEVSDVVYNEFFSPFEERIYETEIG